MNVPHLYPGMGQRAALRSLTRLRELDVRHNRLATVPATLSHLTGLERLSLEGNRLTPAAARRRSRWPAPG